MAEADGNCLTPPQRTRRALGVVADHFDRAAFGIEEPCRIAASGTVRRAGFTDRFDAGRDRLGKDRVDLGR